MDLPSQDLANYEIVIRVDGNVDRRRYNAPTSSEVAGLMPGEWIIAFIVFLTLNVPIMKFNEF